MKYLLLLLIVGCQGVVIEPEYLKTPEPFVAEVSYWGDADPAIELLHMVGFELVQASRPEAAQVVIYGPGQYCDGHKAAYEALGGIWLCEKVPASVLAHEFGHALGVSHVPEVEGPAIMNPHSELAERMTVLDAAAFRSRKYGQLSALQ